MYTKSFTNAAPVAYAFARCVKIEQPYGVSSYWHWQILDRKMVYMALLSSPQFARAAGIHMRARSLHTLQRHRPQVLHW